MKMTAIESQKLFPRFGDASIFNRYNYALEGRHCRTSHIDSFTARLGSGSFLLRRLSLRQAGQPYEEIGDSSDTSASLS